MIASVQSYAKTGALLACTYSTELTTLGATGAALFSVRKELSGKALATIAGLSLIFQMASAYYYPKCNYKEHKANAYHEVAQFMAAVGTGAAILHGSGKLNKSGVASMTKAFVLPLFASLVITGNDAVRNGLHKIATTLVNH